MRSNQLSYPAKRLECKGKRKIGYAKKLFSDYFDLSVEPYFDNLRGETGGCLFQGRLHNVFYAVYYRGIYLGKA